MRVSVTFGIGIDDATNGAVLAGNFRFNAAPATAVASDHDSAFDGDAQAIKSFVIFAIAEIHVYQRSGDVSVDGICVVGGKLFGGLIGSGIDAEDRFLKFGLEL